jgi:hypothetical protein
MPADVAGGIMYRETLLPPPKAKEFQGISIVREYKRFGK